MKLNLPLLNLKTLGVLFATFLLSACSSSTEDLKAWVDRIKAQPPGRIQPMPEIVEYKPHDYSAGHLKSPFSDLAPELEAQLQALHEGCDESVQPDPSRRKEDLEKYSLDSMEMVGVLNNKNKKWGLIKMTAGPVKDRVFNVTEGNYLGINHGSILSITEHQIEISTLVPDSKGCWERRTVYMALAQ